MKNLELDIDVHKELENELGKFFVSICALNGRFENKELQQRYMSLFVEVDKFKLDLNKGKYNFQEKT